MHLLFPGIGAIQKAVKPINCRQKGKTWVCYLVGVTCPLPHLADRADQQVCLVANYPVLYRNVGSYSPSVTSAFLVAVLFAIVEAVGEA
jgi:hypothetical protein